MLVEDEERERNPRLGERMRRRRRRRKKKENIFLLLAVNWDCI